MPLNNINNSTQSWSYLNTLYESITPGIARKEKSVSETNGEILYPSINKLLNNISLTKQDVLLDLGSGRGRFVIQALLNFPVKQVIGIEILPDLHQQALAVASQLPQQLAQSLLLLQGDFLTMQLPQATIVMINSTCFSQPMLYALGEIINHQTSIRTVLTTRPINNLERLRFKKAIRIECSWDTALCYVYS